MKAYNEKLKHHYEKALKHLLILEDMTDYKIKDISEMVDKLFENDELLKEIEENEN